MCAHQTVVSELLQRGLLDARALVLDGLNASAVGRNGTTWLISVPGGAALLVKSRPASPSRGRADAARLASEARALARLNATPATRGYVPAVRAWDASAHLLVLDRWPDAETLREHLARTRRPSVRHALHLGRALASLHALELHDDAWPIASVPWALSQHEPDLYWYRLSSVANIALLELLQAFPALGTELSALRADWRPTALTHGDLKWDNIVVRPRQPGRAALLWLVDWESAAIGDPAWDVGSIFGEYLLAWFHSIPPPDAGAAPAHDLAEVPLAAVQAAAGAFWRGYSEHGTPTDAFRDRAIRSAGAWLIHQAYERLQEATNLTSADARQIQLSFNLLRGPADAAMTLLNLPGTSTARMEASIR